MAAAYLTSQIKSCDPTPYPEKKNHDSYHINLVWFFFFLLYTILS